MGNYFKREKVSSYSLASELAYRIKSTDCLSPDFICDILDNYEISEVKVKKVGWIRFTSPLALIVMIVLIILMPLKYIITGNGGWNFKILSNWFRAVKLM